MATLVSLSPLYQRGHYLDSLASSLVSNALTMTATTRVRPGRVHLVHDQECTAIDISQKDGTNACSDVFASLARL